MNIIRLNMVGVLVVKYGRGSVFGLKTKVSRCQDNLSLFSGKKSENSTEYKVK